MGATFVPPANWTVVTIDVFSDISLYAYSDNVWHQYRGSSLTQRYVARVQLRRVINLDEKIELPPGCQVEVQSTKRTP